METPSNASGTFSEEAQEVVYMYESKEPGSNDKDSSNNHLPKTGEQVQGQIMMTTAGALLVALALVVVKKRKKVDNKIKKECTENDYFCTLFF